MEIISPKFIEVITNNWNITDYLAILCYRHLSKRGRRHYSCKISQYLTLLWNTFIKMTSNANGVLVFRNRKCYFPINLHAVCDASLAFREITARLRGSIHGSSIVNSFQLYVDFESGNTPRAIYLMTTF